MRLARALCVVFLVPVALGARDRQESSAIPRHPDPVIARLLEHMDRGFQTPIVFADRDSLGRDVWNRVRGLVAFRLHRHQADGRTLVDAPIYLVRDSRLYLDAAAALRNHATVKDYLWCLLAAVIAHESAHTAPLTEREALRREADQLRRCLLAGHLHSTDGWNGGSYLMKVEARLRHPQEHY